MRAKLADTVGTYGRLGPLSPPRTERVPNITSRSWKTRDGRVGDRSLVQPARSSLDETIGQDLARIVVEHGDIEALGVVPVCDSGR